jgi:hypothetical protein
MGRDARARKAGLKTLEAPLNLDVTPIAMELHVVLYKDGRIEMNGPLQNPIQMLGLIELAKETYAKIRNQPRSPIVQAAALPNVREQ